MKTTISRSPWLWVYLFALYFSGVFQLLVASSGLVSLAGFRSCVLYSLCWLIIPAIFPRHIKWILAFASLILWPAAIANIGYFIIYGQEMSQGAIFSIFATSSDEAGEFLENYFGWWMPLVIVGFTVPAWWIWTRVQPMPLSHKARIIAAVIAILPLAEPYAKYWKGFNEQTYKRATSRFLGRIESVSPWQLVVAWVAYQRNLATVNDYMATLESAIGDQKVRSTDDTPQQTYLLIIGESTNSGRLGIYGYRRDTTPRLQAMRDELLVFKDVITPRPFTIEALSQVLTFADQANPDRAFNTHNTISMMKSAGFESWWITNQQTVSDRNTTLTAFAQQATHAVYLNNNRLQSASQYDGVVLDHVKRALESSAPRKFIVVHLLGTHFGYEHRYPQEFDKFTEPSIGKFTLSGRALRMYNAYDNAVLYNDYVVSELFRMFKTSTPYGAAIYLADHGEEVFDIRYFQGRDEYNPTTAMYTVPFLVFGTAAYRNARPELFAQVEESRPYSTEHFIHTLCDIASLQFDGCDLSKSVTSTTFQQRARLVGNPANQRGLRDFDALMSKQRDTTVAKGDSRPKKVSE